MNTVRNVETYLWNDSRPSFFMSADRAQVIGLQDALLFLESRPSDFSIVFDEKPHKIDILIRLSYSQTVSNVRSIFMC